MNMQPFLLVMTIASSLFTVGIGGLALIFDGAGSTGQVAPAGVEFKGVLIQFDQADKQRMVAEKEDWFTSSDFKAWMETKVDKKDGVFQWHIWPNGITVSDDMPGWKALAGIPKGHPNALTVINGKYFYPYELPKDEATAKSIIEQVLH